MAYTQKKCIVKKVLWLHDNWVIQGEELLSHCVQNNFQIGQKSHTTNIFIILLFKFKPKANKKLNYGNNFLIKASWPSKDYLHILPDNLTTWTKTFKNCRIILIQLKDHICTYISTSFQDIFLKFHTNYKDLNSGHFCNILSFL